MYLGFELFSLIPTPKSFTIYAEDDSSKRGLNTRDHHQNHHHDDDDDDDFVGFSSSRG